jgi:pimeloyl-ACP methyl ester carboxylesterase
MILALLLACGLSAAEPSDLKVRGEKSFQEAFASLPAPAPVSCSMDYCQEPLSAEVSLDDGSPRARRVRVSFPGRGFAGPGRTPPDNVVHLAIPEGANVPASPPLILVLPMSVDVDYKISRMLCEHFLKKRFRCAYLERPMPYEPEHLENLIGVAGFPPESSVSARQALDVLQQLGYLEADAKIGVAGVSLGAIDAALVAATDPRIGAVAMLLGGADIPRMLASINGFGVQGYTNMRERQLKDQGIGLKELEARLRARSGPADPLTYFSDPSYKGLSPEKFLMINVEGDPTIPNRCSDALCDVISRDGKRPDYEWLVMPLVPKHFKHPGAFLMIWHAEGRMSDHFRRWLY